MDWDGLAGGCMGIIVKVHLCSGVVEHLPSCILSAWLGDR